LTEARAENAWLAKGSHTVQQQALRDFAEAMANFYAGTHGKPTWRKAGRDEGFRIVGSRARKVERLSKNTGRVRIPKAGWVEFRWSRRVPEAKSYRVTLDRGVAVSAALSNGEPLTVPGLASTEARSVKGTVERPGRNVAAKAGLNRGILASGWGLLARRLEQKAPGRVVKVNSAYTSQTCHRCGNVDGSSRESQARFVCCSCGHREHADINAARNIAARARDDARASAAEILAAGHAVTARGGSLMGRPVNREPQLVLAS
jgi:transposase